MRRVALACALLIAAAQAACGPTDAEITVDPATRHQTISGWEVTASAQEAEEFASVPGARDLVFDRAVDEVGVNRVRLEIRSGAENTNRAYARLKSGEWGYDAWRPQRYPTVNDNDDPRVIDWAGFDFSEIDDDVENVVLPLQRRLAARGERLAVNLTYVAFTDQITTGAYIHDDPEEYGEFVLATYLHLNGKYGFVPDTWEVILEPDNKNRYWRNGRVVGRAIVAAARRLRENGFTPRFVAPSVMDMRAAARYFDAMATIPGAIDDLAEFSYHRYEVARPFVLRGIRARADAHGLDTSMLEFWFGLADRSVLHEDLELGRVSAWQGRTLWSLFSIDKTDPRRPALALQPDTRTNLQYFRYVRAGAVRIGARTSTGAMAPLAFVNADGAYVVAVNAKGPGAVTVRGLPAGRYAVSWGTQTENRQVPGVQAVGQGGAVTGSIPAAGVLTIYDTRMVHPAVGAPATP